MKYINGTTFRAEVEWDKNGDPVLYTRGRGSVNTPGDALGALSEIISYIDSGPFEQVCSVYNLLEMDRLPFLSDHDGIRSVVTPRTVHIVVATTQPCAQLTASLLAIAGKPRVRTLDLCLSQKEIDDAVRRWLSQRASPKSSAPIGSR